MFKVPKIHFGVKIATFNKENGQTPILFRETIRSLMNQSYENWTLYLIGDDYEPQEEFDMLASLVPKEKIKFRNVKVNPERKNFPKNVFHYCGGTNATNYSLDWMLKDGICYLAILDHDDIWMPNHLEVLKNAYCNYPEAYFIYTKGYHQILGREVPNIPNSFEVKYDNLPPQYYDILHSSVSWRLDKIPLRYVNTVEQQKRDSRGDFIYGDAYMWQMFKEYFKENKHKFLFLPENTVFHNGA
jgi:glycosyltransferase involved in cell wall biosynthesis